MMEFNIDSKDGKLKHIKVDGKYIKSTMRIKFLWKARNRAESTYRKYDKKFEEQLMKARYGKDFHLQGSCSEWSEREEMLDSPETNEAIEKIKIYQFDVDFLFKPLSLKVYAEDSVNAKESARRLLHQMAIGDMEVESTDIRRCDNEAH
jgi:hypothetical protein